MATPPWVDLADLAVQHRVANAAEAMLQLTYVQIALGFIGAIGLLVTIWYTRTALKQSRDAFEHARKLDMQDRRAWLVVEPKLVGELRVNSPDFAVPLRLSVNNIGNIPAVEVRHAAMLFVSNGEGDQPKRLDAYWMDTLDRQSRDGKRGTLVLPDEAPLELRLTACGDASEFKRSAAVPGAAAGQIGLCVCVSYTSGSGRGRYVTAVGYWLIHQSRLPSIFTDAPARLPVAELDVVRFEGGFAS